MKIIANNLAKQNIANTEKATGVQMRSALLEL
jgi:hypothetical protein